MKQRRRLLYAPEELGLSLERPPAHKPRQTNRGPNRGYGSPEKRAWRTDVWAHLAAFVPKLQRRDCNVFMIESLDGLEIERALSLGFMEEKLHVCNANPAVVASLKRRHPGIRSYGVSAERAFARLEREGRRLDIISLDFCSCLSASVIETLWALRGVVRPTSAVAINLLRGREQKFLLCDGNHSITRGWDRIMAHRYPVAKALRRASDTDRWRLFLLLVALAAGACEGGSRRIAFVREEDGELMVSLGLGPKAYAKLRSFGIYRGHAGSQTMLWAVFGVELGIRAMEEFDVQDRRRESSKRGARVSSRPTASSLKSTGFLQ